MSRRVTKPTESATMQEQMIAFTKSIQNVTKSQESFNKSVEGLGCLISDTFSELELKLCVKQKELIELDEKFAYDERSRKLEVDLNVKEHGYDAALKELGERGEVAVSDAGYKELKRLYEDLKTSREKEVKIAITREQERNAEHVSVLKQTLELKNQAEVAKVQAQLESQVNQIKVLESSIERLARDLDEQRKLTKDVAMAASKQGQMYMPQNNGNSKN
jgi:hypothetical protein